MRDVEDIRVLIVDDDEDDIYLTVDTINEVDEAMYSIETASSPGDALALLESKPFDVVLCDYQLGAITGVQFIQKLRKSGFDVPIILLTGISDKRVDLAALQAGAADFVAKDSITPLMIDRALRYAIANAERQRLLQAVLLNTAAGVFVLSPNNEVTLWNPRFEEFVKLVHGSDEFEDITSFARDIVAADEDDIHFKDRIAERHVSRTSDGNVVVVLHDVTDRVLALKEREIAERHMQYMALHDELTGLPNRAAFNQCFVRQIGQAIENGNKVALLNLDLNRFKEVNDIYGHAAGDRLLRSAAARINECLSDGDYLARIGGDEFVAIQTLGSEHRGIPVLAEKIHNAFREPFRVLSQEIRTNVSIGVAICPDHGTDVETMLINADVAMYRAKSQPNTSISLYDSELDQMLREQRAITQELKTSIDEGNLDVHFQAQASVANRSIIGFEALARWHTHKLGRVPPSKFIPIAEENALIAPLGELVLRQACEIAARWSTDLSVAVNVSPIQILHADLPAIVRETLLKTGLSPSRLELEVTETVLIDDTDRALHVLRQLKAMGVSIAMDDFGTGYSSLSALQAFPFDKIKIDRSFIEKLGQHPQAATIVNAIVGLGLSLDIPVLAEGVETENHMKFLADQGCHQAQGYYIGKPQAMPHQPQVKPLSDFCSAAEGSGQTAKVA